MTLSTTGWVSCIGRDANSTQRMRNARTMLTAGPAEMTTIRFQTFWRKYARWATSGGITSSGFIPVILT